MVSTRSETATIRTDTNTDGGTDVPAKLHGDDSGMPKGTNTSTDDESDRAEQKLSTDDEALAVAKSVRRTSNSAGSDSTKTIRKNSKLPHFTDSEFDGAVSSPPSAPGEVDLSDIESSSARNLIEKRSSGNVVTTEVNVENFLKEALSTLLRQGFLATEPTYVDGQDGKNLQVRSQSLSFHLSIFSDDRLSIFTSIHVCIVSRSG